MAEPVEREEIRRGLTINVEPRRVLRLAGSAARRAFVFTAVLRLHQRDVDVGDHVAVHGDVLPDEETIVLGQWEAVEEPGYLGRRITGRAALQRHRRSRLHRLLDEPVHQLRRYLC